MVVVAGGGGGGYRAQNSYSVPQHSSSTHTHTQGRDTFPFDTLASGFELVVVASISTSRVDDAIEGHIVGQTCVNQCTPKGAFHLSDTFDIYNYIYMYTIYILYI